jgi:membrane fusion protein (multidrug efflux system)
MRPNTASRLAAALCFAASSSLVASCGKADGQDKGAAAPPPLQVTTLRATARAVPVSLEAVGQAEGSREVEIRARVTGIIERRAYEEGMPVAAGALLFVIDPAPYELAVQQARAALLQEQVRKELAESEAKRLEPLAADRAIPQREVDQAIATARQAGAAIASAQAKLKDAELSLSYTRITAPIAGVTGRALRSEGSLVTANAESALLTTLTQTHPVWVRFSLAEADYNKVRGHEKGARVQLVAADGTVAADNGRLNFAAATVDARQGAVQMRAEFPNPNRRWMPGQFVKVRVLAAEQSAIVVPQAALVQNAQSRAVMTVDAEGKVVQKPVQLGGWIGADAIIEGGLKEGEMVIVDNLVKVRPGMAVKSLPSPRPSPKGEGEIQQPKGEGVK